MEEDNLEYEEILGYQGLIFLKTKDQRSQIISLINGSPINYLGFYYKVNINNTHVYKVLLLDPSLSPLPCWFYSTNNEDINFIKLNDLIRAPFLNQMAIRPLRFPCLEDLKNKVDSTDIYSTRIISGLNKENKNIEKELNIIFKKEIQKYENSTHENNLETFISDFFVNKFPYLKGIELCCKIINDVINHDKIKYYTNYFDIDNENITPKEIFGGGNLLLNNVEWLKINPTDNSTSIPILRHIKNMSWSLNKNKGKNIIEKISASDVISQDTKNFLENIWPHFLNAISENPNFYTSFLSYWKNREDIFSDQVNIWENVEESNVPNLINTIIIDCVTLCNFIAESLNKGELITKDLKKLLNCIIYRASSCFDIMKVNKTLPSIKELDFKNNPRYGYTFNFLHVREFNLEKENDDLPYETFYNKMDKMREILEETKNDVNNKREIKLNELIRHYNELLKISGLNINPVDDLKDNIKICNINYTKNIGKKIAFHLPSTKRKEFLDSSKVIDLSDYKKQELVELKEYLENYEELRIDFCQDIERINFVLDHYD